MNADFEGGFAEQPDDVAANVRLAVETGVAGLSIEDRHGNGLFDLSFAIDRICASRDAIDDTDRDTILVGRSEGFLIGQKDIDATIERLIAYAAAGADCLYAPGFTEPSHIEALVKAVAPKPVNVLIVKPDMRVPDLAALGVRRVSTGGFLARAAWAGFEDAARSIAERGELPPHSFR